MSSPLLISIKETLITTPHKKEDMMMTNPHRIEDSMIPAPLLEVQNLSVSFTQYQTFFRQKTFEAVSDLNLRIYEKEIVAVVGASGSGKSLLAHALLDILPYNARCSGTVFYRGELLTGPEPSASPKRKAASGKLPLLRGRELFLVPQSVSYLDPLMKVGPQIRKSSRSETVRKKAEDVLSRYGLPAETKNLYPFELSGGMARRVMIATAVIEDPAVVIADEPTPGLPTATALRVLGHFREIADGGAGVLLITHDLELALQTADRILVFHSGMVLEEALQSDFQNPELLRHPYTKALFQAIPREGFLSGSYPSFVAESGLPGCPFRRSCSEAGDVCDAPLAYRELRGGAVRCSKAE